MEINTAAKNGNPQKITQRKKYGKARIHGKLVKFL
jgi:hypothetical protein